MITVLHGNDIVASRKVLETIKKGKAAEVVVLDGRKTDLPDLTQALESPSFLEQTRLVVLENFLSFSPKREILAYLKKGAFKTNLVLWEKKKLSPKILSWLPSEAQVRLFKLPAVVFKFLESLRPGNSSLSILLLQKTLAKSEPSFVFYLLVRHIRELILALSGTGKLNTPSWRQKKLSFQAQKFSPKKLFSLYQRLLEIDFNQKTGRNPLDLPLALEMFILAIDEA